LRILDPEIVRHFAPAKYRIDLGANVIGYPVHGIFPCDLEDMEAYRAAARRAERTPSASSPTRAATALTGSAASATALTMAVPTPTPSAAAPIARACSAVFTPKPTQTGRPVWPLMRVTASETAVVFDSAAPVMPVIDT